MKFQVLISEDDPALTTLYRAIFGSNESMAIDFASTPAASRELLNKKKYELAIFDINLGESNHDGLDLLEMTHQDQPATKVLMMSTLDDPSTVERSLRLGAKTFVSKNHKFLSTLKSRVNDALSSLN